MKEIKVLSHEEVQQALFDLPGWGYEYNKIYKEFKFDDFNDALGFINKLAGFCEKIDHHPDVHIFYNTILFELQRHDIGGKVTDKDIELAKQIENLYMEG